MTYTVKRIDKGAAIDWSAAQRVEMAHQPWLEPADVRAWAQMCCDGERLYVRLEAQEKNIRATLTEKLDMVCNDSCLEFFYAPVAGDKRYLNFEWNKLGTAYVGFGAERKTRMRLIPKDVRVLLDPKPFDTDGGWGIEFSIPLDMVRMYFPQAAFEGEARGNFYKCGDQTEKPHYLAWSPMQIDHPDFHRVQDFGAIVFE
ncbi:MAG: carbohydrate-binding family 9-like protein [Eubacteriales bacterium]|nr:carbohydrate-binding family 9-like protein [Eubacteriales bacterium]